MHVTLGVDAIPSVLRLFVATKDVMLFVLFCFL